MTKASNIHYSAALVLVGFGRLATDAIAGLTDVVEAVHRQIAFPSRSAEPPWAQGSAAGLTALVYDSIRGVARLVDRGLAELAPRHVLCGCVNPVTRHGVRIVQIAGRYAVARIFGPL